VRVLLLVTLLIATSCGTKEDSNSAADLIDQVATEVREKPRVQMLIRIAGETPTAEELQLQRSIEDAIESERIGQLTASGTQPGYIFVTVEADSSADAIEKLRAIALAKEVIGDTSFRVLTSQ
jgi:hypothetical protein